MHTIPFELHPPRNDADFERMCAHVYGVVFDDRTPKINGRRGQSQGGVDIFVSASGIGRIGIQCKKYTLSAVTWANVIEEVEKADANATPIKRLIVATTAPNDVGLLKKVQLLADSRAQRGLFDVEIEFWDDICQRIANYPILQDSYAPHTPGAAYHRQDQTLGTIQKISQRTHDAVVSLGSLPAARDDSADRLITAQLDRTNELLGSSRYRDAVEHLDSIGKDLAPFDQHQKARWHLQRGLALWLGRLDDKEAALLFLRAHELFPDEDRMAAAHIRGLLLQGRSDEANAAGISASDRFPTSQQVWYAWANVRAVRGERLALADLPVSLKNDPDALQFVSQAELTFGNLDEAIRLSQLAARSVDAGFFAKAAAIRIAADCGARHPVANAFGSLPDREQKALEFAADLLKPWHQHLWSIQSDAVKDVATNLGIVYALLHRFEDALILAREAEARGQSTPELLRIQISCLDDLHRDDDLLSLADARMEEMSLDALAVMSHVAVKYARIDLLGRAYERAKAIEPVPDHTTDLLSALRWECMARSEQQEAAIAEIVDAKVASKGSLVTCCVVARILQRSGKVNEAAAVVDRAQTLVTEASRDSDVILLAELLYSMERWRAAGALFEKLLMPGQVTHLHNRLLACCIRSHNRKRAKSLIESLPRDWIENDDTRHLAIELGQCVADFAFLRPLADAQVTKNPQSVGAWLLKLGISQHSRIPPEFQSDLRSVPEELRGSEQGISQLAAIEIRYGEMHKGMRRLYRMARRKLDDPAALSRYFLSLVTSREDLPLMDQNRRKVSSGSALHLKDEFGRTTRIVIDPADVTGLPEREGFISADSDLGRALIGAEVGQDVTIPMLAFGATQTYTVVHATSAYRHLLEIAQERAHSLGGLPDLKSIPVMKEGDGRLDLTHIQAEMKRSHSISRDIFDLYAQGSLTVARFSELQGRSSMETAIGWPADGPPLLTAFGSHEERDKALSLLARPDEAYVVDNLTLAELVNLGVVELLAHLPKVYISARARAELETRLREAEYDRSVATTTEINDELAFIPHKVNYRQRRVRFFQSILEAVAKYCVVELGYGELNADQVDPRLADILCDEELDLLLLARAKQASVLTMDGRLRVLLETAADVAGVWPQVLFIHCARMGAAKPDQIAAAIATQFLNNRSFIFLRPTDLLWICLQGGDYLQMGMQRFKTHAASMQSDFASTASMAIEFLRSLAAHGTPLNAFAEVFAHVMEGLLRHPAQTEDFGYTIGELIDELAMTWSMESTIYEPVQIACRERHEFIGHYLVDHFQLAQKYASEPADFRPIKSQTLFCTRLPKLWLGRKSPEQSAASTLTNAKKS